MTDYRNKLVGAGREALTCRAPPVFFARTAISVRAAAVRQPSEPKDRAGVCSNRNS